MARGDRDVFKADTEDGYTKIADLLLEALAMAKLNGIQKGICLFLWRRTYGWKQKEDRITLKEFALACDTSEAYVSRQIKQLVELNVIIRTSYDPGKVPTYTFNTRVAEWDKGCINVQGLSDCEIQGLYKCAIQGLHDCARVNQDSGLELQGIEPCLYTDYKHNDHDDDDNKRACVDFVKTYEQEFGRLISPTEIERLKAFIDDGLPGELVCEAIRRTREQGKVNVKYAYSILNDWRNRGITNMAGVAIADKEFEMRKKEGQPHGREPTKNSDPLAYKKNSYFRRATGGGSSL